jgi:hypothetical protein
VPEIWEHPPSTLGNIDDGPLRRVRAADPGAPTINAKKRRRWAPWDVSELDIRECPPSMLRNINGGPLVGADGDPRVPTINVKNVDHGPPRRCRSWRFGCTHHQRKEMPTPVLLGGARAGDPRAPTINAKNHRWRAP